MKQRRHWTAENAESFAHKLAFDFIAQLEKWMESTGVNQTTLAHKLGVSEGAVSKVLNNPQNLTLKTIASYSRALGLKASVVAYDDGDRQNENGLVSSEIFSTCWDRAGKPRDFWSLEEPSCQKSATTKVVFVLWRGASRPIADNLSNYNPSTLSLMPYVGVGSLSETSATASSEPSARLAASRGGQTRA